MHDIISLNTRSGVYNFIAIIVTNPVSGTYYVCDIVYADYARLITMITYAFFL